MTNLYIISGATGMTGNELSRQLVGRGDRVIGFDNFFASSLDPVDKKKVKRILKKNGYEDSVIVEYGVNNPPKETPAINGWVFDFITQNATIRLGKDNRDAIREGIHQLDEIDALVAKELDALDKEQEEPGDYEASENITEE